MTGPCSLFLASFSQKAGAAGEHTATPSAFSDCACLSQKGYLWGQVAARRNSFLSWSVKPRTIGLAYQVADAQMLATCSTPPGGVQGLFRGRVHLAQLEDEDIPRMRLSNHQRMGKRERDPAVEKTA